MAEILPTVVPEYFFRTAGSAKSFGEGAKSSAAVPKSKLEFDVPGWDVRTAGYFTKAIAEIEAAGATVIPIENPNLGKIIATMRASKPATATRAWRSG
jgi:hypothetical protein